MQKIVRKKNLTDVELDVLMLKEDDFFVAYCPSLDLSAYGKSVKEAQRSFEKDLDIFFEETTRKGTLEKVLLKLGWTLRQTPKAVYEPPRISPQELLKLSSKTDHLFKESVSIPL
jgi:hypothetical protein